MELFMRSSIDLYKMPANAWAVRDQEGEVQKFVSIERAATFLESVGVMDEEIDYAIIDMEANANSHAQFGLIEGRFIFSDKEKLNSLMGLA